MTQNKNISFILCTRSYHPDLKKVLSAVRLNFKEGDEILLIINSSDSQAFPTDFLDSFSKIIYHSPPGGGEVRKRGVDESAHQLLAFIDDDTLLSRDWREKSLLHLEKPSVAFTQPRGNGKFKTMYDVKVGKTLIYFFDTAGSLFKKQAILEAGHFDIRLKRTEDSEIATRIFYQGWDTAIAETSIINMKPQRFSLWKFLNSVKADAYLYYMAGMRFQAKKGAFLHSPFKLRISYLWLIYYYLQKVPSAQPWKYQPRKIRCFLSQEDRIYSLSSGTRLIWAETGIRFIHLSPAGEITSYLLEDKVFKIENNIQGLTISLDSSHDLPACIFHRLT